MQIQPQESKLIPEDQDSPYQFQNMSVNISVQDATASFFSNVLQISSDGFTFIQEKEKGEQFTVYAAFRNTTSVGISRNSLMVFVGQQPIQDNDEETPEAIKAISASKAGGNVCLTGHCFSIEIDFEKEGKNVLKEVHDIFVNYMGDADEERQSRYDEDEEFGEMIGADDIDEDGNVISKDQEQQQSEEKQQEQLNHSTEN